MNFRETVAIFLDHKEHQESLWAPRVNNNVVTIVPPSGRRDPVFQFTVPTVVQCFEHHAQYFVIKKKSQWGADERQEGE